MKQGQLLYLLDDDFTPPSPTDPGYDVFIHSNNVLDGCIVKAASGSNGETKYNINNQGYVKIRKLKKHFQGDHHASLSANGAQKKLMSMNYNNKSRISLEGYLAQFEYYSMLMEKGGMLMQDSSKVYYFCKGITASELKAWVEVHRKDSWDEL